MPYFVSYRNASPPVASITVPTFTAVPDRESAISFSINIDGVTTFCWEKWISYLQQNKGTISLQPTATSAPLIRYGQRTLTHIKQEMYSHTYSEDSGHRIGRMRALGTTFMCVGVFS